MRVVMRREPGTGDSYVPGHAEKAPVPPAPPGTPEPKPADGRRSLPGMLGSAYDRLSSALGPALAVGGGLATALMPEATDPGGRAEAVLAQAPQEAPKLFPLSQSPLPEAARAFAGGLGGGVGPAAPPELPETVPPPPPPETGGGDPASVASVLMTYELARQAHAQPPGPGQPARHFPYKHGG